jgi:Uma2 family endonuclease
MPTTLTTQQAHWQEIVGDPALQDLPYKVETNERGQVLLSPHSNRHSKLRTRLFLLLQKHAPDGLTSVEYALATPDGVKVADVVWMSPEREREMEETGDPSTLAPEICVEVMSTSNTEEEREQNRVLYRDIGAEDVWVVDDEGQIRFFGDDEMESSRIAPACPAEVQLR